MCPYYRTSIIKVNTLPKCLLPGRNQPAYFTSMGFSSDIQRVLTEFVRLRHSGNKSAAAVALGVNGVTLWRWLKGERTPRTDVLAIAMDSIGAHIKLPHDSDLNFCPSDFDKALADVLSGLLTVHNLTHEKAASSLWPETANGAAKLGRILTAKEPLTPEVLMQLCLLMEEDPGKLLRLARERVQPEGEQISGNAKSA